MMLVVGGRQCAVVVVPLCLAVFELEILLEVCISCVLGTCIDSVSVSFSSYRCVCDGIKCVRVPLPAPVRLWLMFTASITVEAHRREAAKIFHKHS